MIKVSHNENEIDYEIFKLCVSPVCSAQHKSSLYPTEIVTQASLFICTEAACFHRTFRQGNLKVKDTEHFSPFVLEVGTINCQV